MKIYNLFPLLAGPFGDWQPQYILDDDISDSESDDMDIVKYGTKGDNTKLSFYLGVEGEMMGGLMIPAENPQIITREPTPPGPVIDGGGPTDVPLPVNQGEDTLRIFLDTDNNILTGFNPFYGGRASSAAYEKMSSFPLGAEYMLEMTGKNGEVLEKGIKKFNGMLQMQWAWEDHSTLTTGVDQTQLETQVDLSTLQTGLDSSDPIRVYFWVSDWGEDQDDSNMSISDGIISKDPDLGPAPGPVIREVSP